MSNQSTNLTLSYRPSSQDANILHVMTSIHPINCTVREPLDICCVIDVSGSMGGSASAQGVEDAGLTILDIVKHAVRTVFSCLNENDRVSLVSYSNNATVELPLTQMDQAGKDAASQVIGRLYPTGSTNIWDGLLTGMETFPQKLTSRSRNSALFLLTDGAPNILPPKGHIPSMKDYKDSHGGVYPATISTFGFGYNLKSQLLNEIALEGGGSYSFIPDCGFVGTIFVNALANQLNSFATHAALSLEVSHGAVLVPESLDATCAVVTPTSWGALLSLGNLPYNQRRDFVFSVDISNWNRRGVFLEGTLTYESFVSDEKITITCQSEENDITPVSGIEDLILTANMFRSSVIERTKFPITTPADKVEKPKEKFGTQIIKKFLGGDEKIVLKRSYREVGHPDPVTISLADEMKAWCDGLESSSLPSSVVKPVQDYVNGLYLDLTGEINMAFEDRPNFDKWGQHYLPSIQRAHQLQQCNNFKDPGVQFYGGPLFSSLRDQAEDIFCTLPAPTPSGPPRSHTRSSSSAAPTNSSPVPYDMSAYMNASAGCVSGDSKILLADGTIKLMKEICKGDLIRCNFTANNPNNLVYQAPVECLVKTRCLQPIEMIRYKSGLLITPWHPVFLRGSDENMKWSFPFDSENKTEVVREEFVYNLVLGQAQRKVDDETSLLAHRGQSYVANEIECIALAHGITQDSTAHHEFYGTELVVKSLKSLVGEESYEATGLVSMDSSQVIRDSVSGLVCSYAP